MDSLGVGPGAYYVTFVVINIEQSTLDRKDKDGIIGLGGVKRK